MLTCRYRRLFVVDSATFMPSSSREEPPEITQRHVISDAFVYFRPAPIQVSALSAPRLVSPPARQSYRATSYYLRLVYCQIFPHTFICFDALSSVSYVIAPRVLPARA